MLGMSSSRGLSQVVNKFVSLVSGSRKVYIVTHRNADPDAVASSLAVYELIKSLSRGVDMTLYVPEGAELISKNLLQYFGYDLNLLRKEVSISDIDLVVVLDAASEYQLGTLGPYISRFKYVVIDHHKNNNLIQNSVLNLVVPEASSTSELVVLMCMELGFRPNDKLASMLIAGILYDTKFLRIMCRPETFEVISWLLRCGGKYSEVIDILTKKEVSYSEKVAKLKAMSRLGLYAVNNYLVAITCIGAFESSVLKTLIDSGADLAIAVCRRNEGVRIIIRSSKTIVNGLKEPVAANLAKAIGEELGGSYGGHAGASGVFLRGLNPKDLIKVISKFFRDRGYRFRVLEEGRWLKECEE